MERNVTFGDKLWASGKDALNPFYLFIRFGAWLFFGGVVAFPYLVRNMNALSANIPASAAWYEVFVRVIWALMKTTSVGMVLSLSTVSDSFIRFVEVLGTPEYGTIIFVIIVLAATTFFVYQPLFVVWNIFDQVKGVGFSRVLVFGVSFMIALFVLAPTSYAIMRGETITSGIDDNSTLALYGLNNETIPQINGSVINISDNLTEEIVEGVLIQ